MRPPPPPPPENPPPEDPPELDQPLEDELHDDDPDPLARDTGVAVRRPTALEALASARVVRASSIGPRTTTSSA